MEQQTVFTTKTGTKRKVSVFTDVVGFDPNKAYTEALNDLNLGKSHY